MKQLIQIMDSLLYAITSQDSSVMADPTFYRIETNSNVYGGYIIFQDDMMIKFRTIDLKPVKILKQNIVRVKIANEFLIS